MRLIPLEKQIKVIREQVEGKYSPLVLTLRGATTCVVKRGSRTIIHEGDLRAHHVNCHAVPMVPSQGCGKLLCA
jgi:hypothetical protein